MQGTASSNTVLTGIMMSNVFVAGKSYTGTRVFANTNKKYPKTVCVIKIVNE